MDGQGFSKGARMASSGGGWPTFGIAYGVILNTRAERDRMAAALHAPPYKAPPVAPALYVKPPSTFGLDGRAVEVPSGLDALEANGAVAMVIGRQATRVRVEDALDHVAAYVPVLDVCEPHDSYFRPAVRQRCRDGFLPIGRPLAADEAGDPGAFAIEVRVNGAEAAAWSTADLARPAARLIADVTDFMTLSPGDLLILGLDPSPTRAGPGDRVEVRVPGFQPLAADFVREGATA